MTFKNTFQKALNLLTMVAMLVSLAAFAESDTKHGITIEDLAAITDIKTMALSPDGKYIAYQTMQPHKESNDFTVEWYVAPTTPNAKAVKVADGGEAIINKYSIARGITLSEIIWSPDSEWIYFTQTKQGAVQLWRSHRSQYGQQQLTHNEGNVHDLYYSTKGSKILFTIGRTRAEIKTLIKQEAQQGYVQQEPSLYNHMGPNFPICSNDRDRGNFKDHDAAFLPVATKGRVCHTTVWAYDIKSGHERRAIKGEVKDFYAQEESWTSEFFRRATRGQKVPIGDKKRLKRLSTDGKRLAWIENENPDEFKGMWPPVILTVSRKNKNMRCPSKLCRNQFYKGFKGLWWHANGPKGKEEIIFQVRNGRRKTLSSLYGWTPGDSDVRTIVSSDDLLSACDLMGKRLICGQETWTSPKKIVSIDLDSGRISTIVDVNPNFRDFRFTKIEKLFGNDGNGHNAHAHLVYPKDYQKGQRYPLVIVQYRSRGFLRGGVGDEQPIHAYAQNGLAVLSFDVPDVIDHEKIIDRRKNVIVDYSHAIVTRGPAAAIEIMVDALVARGIIDPDRVGISGLSYGAVVLDSALLGRNYAAASAAYSVPTGPNYFWPPSSIFGKAWDGIFGGPPLSPKGSEMRRKFSIETNASKIDTPYLIQSADRETHVSKLNYNALKGAGKPVEMIIYPDEYHVKWQPAHKYMVYSRNLDWFNFWLQGIEDPDPAKAEQYERWRELREMHEANLEKLEEIKE